MRISDEALARFKQRSRIAEPVVRYVPVDEELIIGYTVLAERGPKRISAQGVRAQQLVEPPVRANCVLDRVGTAGRFYAITIKQGPGPIWYRWVNPEGVKQDVLVFATEPDDDLTAAIQNTRRHFKRHGIIMRVAQRAGVSTEKADIVCAVVRNKLNLAYASFQLAEHLRKTYGPHNALSQLNALTADPSRDSLAKTLARLNIATNPTSVEKIALGARAALTH